jgi:protein-tyrosine phosphatase
VLDLHSHILPGLDDGARTLDDSLAIATAAASDGVRVLAATPHVRADYPTSAEAMERALAETQAAVREAGVEIELRPGGEIAIDYLPRLDDDALRRFGLGGNPSVLLVETPYFGWPLGMNELIFSLRTKRLTPVLGHPERNAEVAANPERLRPLVEAGALVQVTAASVDGRLGRAARETAFALLERELVHMLASDAHEASLREAGLSRAAAELGEDDLAQWLVEGVPAAILADQPLPARPSRRRRIRIPWRA